jgi:hypothetical protein
MAQFSKYNFRLFSLFLLYFVILNGIVDKSVSKKQHLGQLYEFSKLEIHL